VTDAQKIEALRAMLGEWDSDLETWKDELRDVPNDIARHARRDRAEGSRTELSYCMRWVRGILDK